MPDEPRLREQACEAIQIGTLPSRLPSRTSSGPGVGGKCGVCAHPVANNQIELEAQFETNGAMTGTDTYRAHRFHLRCFAAWQFERAKVGAGTSD
jgi:hypothetical protein